MKSSGHPSLPVAIPLLLASSPFLPAEEATIRGASLCREDFERCSPAERILSDENRKGFWNLRSRTWGDQNLLYGNPDAPDIAYDPDLEGCYDIDVESRATDRPGGFGLKLPSEPEFTDMDVPNEGATKTRHFNVWLPFHKNVRMDNDAIILRYRPGRAAYIDSFRFTPLGRFERGSRMREEYRRHAAKLGPETRKQSKH